MLLLVSAFFFFKNHGYESAYLIIYFLFIRSCESGSLNATLAKGKAILCFQHRSAMDAVRTVRSYIRSVPY
jgi:hypothetical protein